MLPSWVAHDPRMTYRRFKLFSALSARRNQKTKLCIPSHSTIHQDTCLDEQDVKKELNRAKADGLLDWEKRFDENGGAISNSYTLHFMAEVDKALEGSRGKDAGGEKPARGSREKDARGSRGKDAGPSREKDASNNEDNSEANIKDNIESFPLGGKKQKTLLRENWEPTTAGKQFCIDQGHDPKEVIEGFIDHFFHANKIPMKDWNIAWLNYVAEATELKKKGENYRQRIARNRNTG